jgi:hypothetical protein
LYFLFAFLNENDQSVLRMYGTSNILSVVMGHRM